MRLHPRISARILVTLAAVATSVTGVFAFAFKVSADMERSIAQAAELAQEMPAQVLVPRAEVQAPSAKPVVSATNFFAMPIDKAASRVTKKPFGIEIHPETSPVTNDRFNGFHVGVDFETFPEEADAAIPVYAICRGPMLFKKQAAGYGGVAVQGCIIGGEEVSVIYGHLNVASVLQHDGTLLVPGERIGVLGKGGSEETDGVRKHLHLGIRKSRTLDIRGYVPTEEETLEYLDAQKFLGL